MLNRGVLGAIAAGRAFTPPEEATDYAAVVDGLSGGPPIAHWRLGDVSGQLVDRKAGARHATVNGTVMYGAPRLPQDSDDAVDFAGTGYGERAHDSGLALPAFTLSFWFQLTRLPAPGEDRFALISKDLSGFNDGDLTVWIDSDGDVTAQFQSASAGFPVVVAANLVVGDAYHVAVRAHSGGFDLIVNVSQSVLSGYTAAWVNNAQPLRFGAVEWLVTEAGTWPADAVLLDGVLDEIALYNRALTNAEILELSQFSELPTAVADVFSLQESTTGVLDLVANDSFIGAKADLNLELLTPPSAWGSSVLTTHGQATVRSDKNVDFVAGDVSQQEVDSFDYRITDSLGQSNQATTQVTISETPVAGTGDGKGGDLIWQWVPQTAWANEPDSTRFGTNAVNLARFTDPVATAGSSLQPFAFQQHGGGKTHDVCYNFSPDGYPCLEIGTEQGFNSAGLAVSVKFWPQHGTNPRHLRFVIEWRPCDPSDPTTYKSRGIFPNNPSAGTYGSYEGAVPVGYKLFCGMYGYNPSASCRYNWCKRPELPTSTAMWRIGGSAFNLAGAGGGSNPPSSPEGSLGLLNNSWDKPRQCEVAKIEDLSLPTGKLDDWNGRWHRLELELKLCSPGAVPSNATTGNTGYPTTWGALPQNETLSAGQGDGHAVCWLTKDLDGNFGPTIPRFEADRWRNIVTFPRTDNNHIRVNLNAIMFTYWIGGTGGSTLCQIDHHSWIRKAELYHYAEDDI